MELTELLALTFFASIPCAGLILAIIYKDPKVYYVNENYSRLDYICDKDTPLERVPKKFGFIEGRKISARKITKSNKLRLFWNPTTGYIVGKEIIKDEPIPDDDTRVII